MDETKAIEVVNEKTGEVVNYAPTPEDLLVAASEAAKALERVIKLNERPPIMFNGKRYLEFHHWQTIGKFYHVTARTFDAQVVEIGGVAGFKAKAEAVDEKTGQVVGSAEAYCLRDEPNWKTKPTFQLASMAQTRAASKALSNKFRFVAIVAGYEGTPSEEMTADTSTQQRQVAMPKKKAVAQDAIMAAQAPLPSIGEQVRAATKPPESKFFAALHKVAREKKLSNEQMKAVIKILYKKDSSKELTDAECADLIKKIESGVVHAGE